MKPGKRHNRIIICCAFIGIAVFLSGATNAATEKTDLYAARKTLYDQISVLTGIPWHYLAAIDQYERTITIANKGKRPEAQGLSGVYIPPGRWSGELNPDQDDNNLHSIAFFGGLGKDGNGDGKADRTNDYDVLASIAAFLLEKGGTSWQDFRIGLWEYYHNPRNVQRISQFANIYAAFSTLDLDKRVFPLPLGANYSYRSTWGAGRSWGGRRIHEGTDIFAGYGVPVRSTCYGIVEVKGWNRYGGWRIGIRDIQNVYHYYAHLSGYAKELVSGQIVKPGDVIGWVGSSGYGKPGTQGKFPPHLHFGLYRDSGMSEWSFDPTPYLYRWEREERKAKRRG